GKVNGTLRQDNSRLRISDHIDGLKRICRHDQRRWIGITNVFGGKYHHSACDEPDIFTALDHACKVIDSRIRITTSDGFDECADNVVMLFTTFVIDGDFLLGYVHDKVIGDGDVAFRKCFGNQVEEV